MGELALPPGFALPAPPPRIVLPDPRLLLPGAQALLRRPLRRWWKDRTSEDAFVAAATLDANLGTKAQASSATATFVTANPVASGGFLVIGAGFFAPSGASASVTTTGGLTWTATTQTISGSNHGYLFYAFAPSGLASSTSLTWTIAGAATADWMIGGGSFLGIDNVGDPLLATNGASATATAWSSGSIAAGATNLGVVMAFEDGSGTATSTSTSPLTELTDFNNAGQAEAFTLAYNLASAATATLAGTWSTSVTHVARGGAFEIAAGAAAASLLVPPFRSTSSLYNR